jgi:hypothetical protein
MQVFPADLTEFAILHLGCQGSGKDACADWRQTVVALRDDVVIDQPFEFEHSGYTDPQGNWNEFFLLYFDTYGKADAWYESKYKGYFEGLPADGKLGFYFEMLKFPLKNSETMFTPSAAVMPDKYAYGVGRKGVDGGYYPTHLCNYSGSARDRIPESGIDPFTGIAADLLPNTPDETKGQRVALQIPKDISVIRSGQDWALSEGPARENYMKVVEPTLKAGMDYLSHPDTQHESGTICNRFAYNLEDDGTQKESSFGLVYSLSLGHLEAWACIDRDENGNLKGHPTHNKIYENFYASINPDPDLSLMKGVELFHEIMVTPSEGCFAEYVNCHNKTGFLGWASGENKLY